jgi:hypothetical protein
MIKDIIRYNSLRSLADVTLDFDGEVYLTAGVTLFPAGGLTFPPINGNPSRIFVKADLLQNALPHLQSIPNAFHLLTGSSDISACPTSQFAEWIRSNTKIATWVGTNLEEFEPWMLCVPIGLEERGRIEREPEQFALLNNADKSRSIDIYLPFLGKTHSSRQKLLDKILEVKHHRVFVEENRLTYRNYLTRLRSSHYTICPRGNGADTLRIYEAAIAGSMPIVQKTGIWRTHRDLGFLIFEELTDIFHVPSYSLKRFIDLEKISLSFQIDRIFRHQLMNYCQR